MVPAEAIELHSAQTAERERIARDFDSTLINAIITHFDVIGHVSHVSAGYRTAASSRSKPILTNTGSTCSEAAPALSCPGSQRAPRSFGPASNNKTNKTTKQWR